MKVIKRLGFSVPTFFSIFSVFLMVPGVSMPELPDTLFHNVAAPPAAGFQQDVLLGSSVASSAQWIAVGAPGDKTLGGLNSGVVKVFNSETGELSHFITNPNPVAFGNFGTSLAVSGSRLLVGVPNESSRVGIAYLFDLASENPTVPVNTFRNPTRQEFSNYGSEVAIEGDNVVVGMPNGQGVLYVYDISESEPGKPERVVEDPVRVYQDYVGRGLSLSENRLAYYSAFAPDGGQYRAGVKIYDLAAEEGSEALFSIPTPGSADYVVFGEAICLQGSRLVVGNFFDGTQDRLAVYDLDGENPEIPTRTLPSSRNSVLALDGSLIAVGTTTDRTRTFPEFGGGVLVYDLDNISVDAPLKSLANPVSSERGLFGESVSVFGRKIIIGAPGEDTSAIDAGAAYVLDADQEGLLRLEEPGPAIRANFGAATAVSGNIVVLGAPEDDTVSNNSGSAYVFDLSSQHPTIPLVTLRNPDPYASARFGYSVAVSGDAVVIGTYGGSSDGEPAKVYVYDLTASDASVPTRVLTSPAATAGDRFGSALAMNGALLAIGAPAGSQPYKDTGMVYLFDLGADPETPALLLEHPIPVRKGFLGTSVAISGRRVIAGAPSFQNYPDIFSGAAIVFDLEHPETPGMVIENPTRSKRERFGASVGICGTRIIVGDPSDSSPGTTNGNVFIFDLTMDTPTTPTHHFNFNNRSPSGTLLGGAVGISGTWAFVGSRDYSYIYDISRDTLETPSLQFLHTPANQVGYDHASLAVDGSTFVIGAPSASNSAFSRGTAFVFKPSLPAREQFDAAVLAAGLEVDLSGPDAIPFDDGSENLIKYAFHMNLSGADFSISGDNSQPEGLPLVSYYNYGYFYIEFLRKKRSRLKYTPQISSTLEADGWRDLVEESYVSPINDDWELVTYQETLDPATDSQQFGRVKVEFSE